MKHINTVIELSYALALATIFLNICTKSMEQIPLVIPLGLVVVFLIAVIVAAIQTLKEM